MEETMKCKDNECKCGKNRWQTVKKGLQYKCRHCGNSVSVSDSDSVSATVTESPESPESPEIKET